MFLMIYAHLAAMGTSVQFLGNISSIFFSNSEESASELVGTIYHQARDHYLYTINIYSTVLNNSKSNYSEYLEIM